MKNNDKNTIKNNDYKATYNNLNYIKSNFKIDYSEKDGVFYPNLTLSKENTQATTQSINGKYAQLRLDFLKKHRKGTYTTLLTEGNLSSHLAEIDKTAREQVKAIIDDLAKQSGCGDDLKSANQLLWVQMMNNFKASAEEVVLNELIYS